MTKHVYELPDGWEQEIDEQYPVPEYDPDEPDDPEEPEEAEFNGTSFNVQVTENNKTFKIQMGFALADDNVPATIDWGDGETTTYEQSQPYGVQHRYNNSGTYTIKIDDTISTFGISNRGFGNVDTNAEMVVGDILVGDKVT